MDPVVKCGHAVPASIFERSLAAVEVVETSGAEEEEIEHCRGQQSS